TSLKGKTVEGVYASRGGVPYIIIRFGRGLEIQIAEDRVFDGAGALFENNAPDLPRQGPAQMTAEQRQQAEAIRADMLALTKRAFAAGMMKTARRLSLATIEAGPEIERMVREAKAEEA